MEDDNSLNITITAVDDASSVIEGLAETVDSLSEAIAPAAQAVNEAFDEMSQGTNTFGDSMTALSELMSTESDLISEAVLGTGVSFNSAAETVAASVSQMEDDANGLAENWSTVAALMTGDTTDIEAGLTELTATAQSTSVLTGASLLIMGQVLKQIGSSLTGFYSSTITAASSADSAQASLAQTVQNNITQGKALSNSDSDIAQQKQFVIDQINAQKAALDQLSVPISGMNKTTVQLGAAEEVQSAKMKTATDTLNTLYGTLDKFNNLQSSASENAATVTAQFDAAAKANEKLGFSYSDTLQALAMGNTALGGSTEALQENQVAMDLVALHGGTLETATDALNKAFAGSGFALYQYGISVKQGLSGNQILKTVMDQVTGAAAAQAKTMGGSLSILSAQWNDLMTTLGNTQGGVLTNLVKTLSDIITGIDSWVEKNPKLAQEILILAGAIGAAAVAGGTLLTFFALIAIVSASAATAAALTFILIGVAIVAAAIFIIANWNTVKTWFDDFIKWITTTFTAGWDIVKNAATTVGTAIVTAFTTVESVLHGIWVGIENSVVDVMNTIIDAIDTVITGINTLISVMQKIPGVKNLVGTIPLIPHITAVDDAIISPGGNVITTNPNDFLIATQNPAGLLSGATGGGATGQNIYVNVTGDVLTTSQQAIKLGNQLAKEIGRQLRLTAIK
jgi:hypothetical protein